MDHTNQSRRGFIVWLVSLAGVVLTACATRISDQTEKTVSIAAATTQPTPTPTPTLMPSPTAANEIVQPTTPGKQSFIDYASEMRRIAIASGDQSFGAIIVKDNRVVGLGPSRVVINHDATAHAEMEALRDASQRLASADLSGCVMYSTARPCRMCETAGYWARIDRMYVGSTGTDAGAPNYGSC
jgi:tRNA(Arg) A34 adenosine deaminase TadA